MRESEQLKHVMVLRRATPGELEFAFQARMWAGITLALSCGLLVASFYAWSESGVSLLVVVLVGFSMLLLYSTVYSATGRRMLVVASDRGHIEYFEKTMRADVQWQKPFADFESVGVYHPREGVSQRAARNLVIEIRARDGSFYRVGRNEFGSLTRDTALELVTKIAARTGLPLSDETRA